MATSFGWKRKLSQNVARKRARAFDESDQIPDDSEDEPFELDWRVLLVKRGALSIEDKVVKSKRLEDEGVSLAEQQRYWEAITRLNEAISLTPNNEKLYEMKSQILLELHGLFPAIQAAEKAVSLNPHWYIAHQTLGRAQMSYGDVEMMWTEGLQWAWKLRDQKRKQDKDNSNSISTQESKELLELYAVDLEQDNDFKASILKCNHKKEPVKDVT